MAITSQTNIEDFGDMTIRAKAVEVTDDMTIADDLTVTGDLAVTGNLVVTGNITVGGTVAIDLTNVPAYADQAAGATALAAGRVFRIDTTGALAVALT